MNFFSVRRFAALLVVLIPALMPAQPTPTDTLRIVALRVEFQPDEAESTTGDGTFDLGTPAHSFQIDPPPHNRRYFQDHLLFARNYFLKASKGGLLVEGEVYPEGETDAYRLADPMTAYNPNTSPEAINEGLARLLRDAVQLADADPAVDFTRFDAVVVFHAGVGRDIDLGFDDTPQDIPSLFITPDFLQTYLGSDAIPVDGGAGAVRGGIILPETESQEGLELGLNGILVSNIGSQLGFLDLFSPSTGRSGVGRFGLMDAGLFNGDGLLPALPTAWTRLEAGWSVAQTITQAQDDAFTVHEPLSDAGPTIYRFPINATEYFLVENRYAGERSLDSLQFVMSDQRGELISMREVLNVHFPDEATFSDATGVLIDIDNPDRGLPGGGILIWHIDESVIAANRAANRINTDPDRRGVDLEEADGSQDIGAEFDFISGGAGSEIGTPLDPWFEGNVAPLYEQDPAGEFSVASIPNSRSYVNRANSHITLNGFSRRGPVMTFQARMNFFLPNFPRIVESAANGNVLTLKTADLDRDGVDDLLMTTDAGALLGMNAAGLGVGPNAGVNLELWRIADGEFRVAPAVFDYPGGGTGIVALAHAGPQRVDTRLLVLRLTGGQADTVYVRTLSPRPNAPPTVRSASDTEVRLSVELTNGLFGELYELVITATDVTLFPVDGDPLSAVWSQVLDNGAFAYGDNSNRVYIDDVFLGAFLPGKELYRPPGSGQTATPQGRFINIATGDTGFPEDELFRIDAPFINVDLEVTPGDGLRRYVAGVGDNRLLLFNPNLTLVADFPVPLYRPERETDLAFSPIAAMLPGGAGQDTPALVAADPAGMLIGIDGRGRSLPDFPLSAGDSLSAAPVALDLDGDGSTELAAVTRDNTIYVWDFPSTFARGMWSQPFADAGNRNRLVAPVEGPSGSAAADLMPADGVYNWPNPNVDDFTLIRYRLTESADVEIAIYDLAGDLVKRFAGPGQPDTDNEVRWDLAAVQSGVYLARVEARGATRSDVRTIKIAVVK